MHVISAKKLRQAWTTHRDAEKALRAWLRLTERAEWKNIAEVRRVFSHADPVDDFTVFNIGGNKYRLIVAIHYNRGKVYVRHFLTHEEYDLDKWKERPSPSNRPKGPKKPKDEPG
jgi:mRNA interferase HigB